MTYKTILVHAGVEPAADSRLQAAVSLGACFEATVFGVGAFAWDPYSDPALGYVDAETIQALRDEVDSDIADAESRFRKACADHVHGAIWRSVVDYPDRAMAALSRCADLIVASSSAGRADHRRVANPQNLVMETGLPVMLLAPGVQRLQPRTVVVGWKNTRETRRAVADSLPFLKIAEKVVVMQVREDESTVDAAIELDDVVGRLDRHGVKVQRESLPRWGATVAEDLLEIAKNNGADLLVLGAYGRARLREWMFGGVTSDVLAATDCSVLFGR